MIAMMMESPSPHFITRLAWGNQLQVRRAASTLTDTFGLSLLGGRAFYTREAWSDWAYLWAAVPRLDASGTAVNGGVDFSLRTIVPVIDRPCRSTLVAIVKDELDLPEWIAYHAVMGFDCAVIYDHGSVVPVAPVSFVPGERSYLHRALVVWLGSCGKVLTHHLP